jgi:hypothetical protein
VGAAVKVVENIFYYREKSVGLVTDDRELQSKLGIDFEGDRKKLRIVENKVKDKFSTKCLKYGRLFMN